MAKEGSIVVQGVSEPERAVFEVGVLNRDVRFVKFQFVDDMVIASLQLPAWPFVPMHLRTLLGGMASKLDEIDDDLVARVGGRRAFEPDAEELEEVRDSVATATDDGSSLHPGMLTLLQLDAGGPGSVDPEMAAGVCDFDRDVVLRFIRESEGQEIAWRSARDDALLSGDRGEAAACDHELQACERMTVLLRRALRVVVERSVGRGPTATTYDVSSAQPRHFPRGRPRKSAQAPRRPPAITDVAGLLQSYGCDDLYELDEVLSAGSDFAVETFSSEDGIAARVDGYDATVEFPFTVDDFRRAVAELAEQASQVADADE